MKTFRLSQVTAGLGLALALLLGGVKIAAADPPQIPPTPPPRVPCIPLVCLQVTDAKEVGADEWLFEFEMLNWTQFTDRACPPGTPACLNRTSLGAEAYGLTFVRFATRSDATWTVEQVDPNGAPMSDGVPGTTSGVLHVLGSSPSLGANWVSEIVSVVDPLTLTALPDTCYDRYPTPTFVSVIDFDLFGCPVLETVPPTAYDVTYLTDPTHHANSGNSWVASSCGADLDIISWSTPADFVAPSDSYALGCPFKDCEQRDELDPVTLRPNAKDGFLIRAKSLDHNAGDRLVFSWYMTGADGLPIADGSPPTPTSVGSLRPNANDPWGFSFGSFELAGQKDCGIPFIEAPPFSPGLGGPFVPNTRCDTAALMPNVQEESPGNTNRFPGGGTCLIDERLDRGELPFDFYISLSPVGGVAPCELRAGLRKDDKGIARLVVEASTDESVDSFRVLITDSKGQVVIDDQTPFPPSFGSHLKVIHLDGLSGHYEATGSCDLVAGGYTFPTPLNLVIPQRGDEPTVASDVSAVVVDDLGGHFAVTGSFDTDFALPFSATDVCTIVQFYDGQESHIIAKRSTIRRLDPAGELVFDGVPPSLDCPTPISVGTMSDGNGDCQVAIPVTVTAYDGAGPAVLTSPGIPPVHLFGSETGGIESTCASVTRVITGNIPDTVHFDVTDGAGATASCDVGLEVVDDTVPEVGCDLIPYVRPSSQPCVGCYTLGVSVADNCDSAPTSRVTIDGIPVPPATIYVKLVEIPPGPPRAWPIFSPPGELAIYTNRGGILTVTAVDAAGNATTCRSCPGAKPGPIVNR